MQYLFFIIFRILSLCFFLFNHPLDASNKRMVVLIDQRGVEKVGGKSAGTNILSLSLHQKACSILVSHSILKAFIERKYQHNTERFYQIINFNILDWKIYHLKNSNFFFLTPSNQHGLIRDVSIDVYGQQFFSYEKISTTKKNLSLGISELKELIIPLIKTHNLEQFLVPSATIQNLYDWINQKKQPNKIFEIQQLESLFFSENDFKNMQPLLDDLSFIDQNIKDKIKRGEIAYQTLLKTAELASDEISPQERDILQSKIDFITSITQPWNFFVFGHGSYEYRPVKKHLDKNKTQTFYSIPAVADLYAISGLTLDPGLHEIPNQLIPFLLFFNTINTHLLAISSCYSGGKNLNYIRFKEGLKKDKISNQLRYILAVLSSTDSVTTTVIADGRASAEIMPNLSTNAERFFQILEGEQSNNKATLTDALHALALPFDLPQNIPQVLIPGQEWFQVFTPIKAKSIINLDDNFIKKYHQNNIKMSIDRDIRILLLTNVIPLEITIDASKPLPRFIPKIADNPFYVFNKITITNVPDKNIMKYIENFFPQGKSESGIVFFIKKLKLIAPSNIEVANLKNLLSVKDKNETLEDDDPESKKYSNYLINSPQLPVKKIKSAELVSLGDTLIKKHEVDNSPLDLAGAKSILLSKNSIFHHKKDSISYSIVPIDIQIDTSVSLPHFISRIPEEATHIFNKIVIQNASQPKEEYLKQLFLGTLTIEAEKKFFIATLAMIDAGNNKQISKNILITTLKNKISITQLADQNDYTEKLNKYFAKKAVWTITHPLSLPGKIRTLKKQLTTLKEQLAWLAKQLKILSSKLQ